MTQPSTSPTKTSPLPRSKRQPFEPTGNTDNAEKEEMARPPSVVEPLSIKKKASSVRSEASTVDGRRAPSVLRSSPNARGAGPTSRKPSQIRVSRIPVYQAHTGQAAISAQSHRDAVEILELCQTTKEDVSPCL